MFLHSDGVSRIYSAGQVVFRMIMVILNFFFYYYIKGRTLKMYKNRPVMFNAAQVSNAY